MFSSSIKLLIRSQCYRSLSTVFPAIREQHLLQIKPNFTKHLVGNVRFIMKNHNQDPENVAKEGEKKVRRRTPEIPKITLLDGEKIVSICTMEQAVKLAEGRHLRLIKIVDMDARTKRPIYKLMSEAQFLEEEIHEKKKRKDHKNSSVKGEKIVVLSCRITENDLKMKMNKAEKWLEKNYEVRVTIAGPENSVEEQENVYQKFENIFKEKARFLQKRSGKDGSLRFQLTPLPNASTASDQIKPVKQKKNTKTVQVEEEEFDKEVEVDKPEESNSEQKQTKQNILSNI